MKENKKYEEKIKQQHKDYTRYNTIIQHLTDKLLNKCNTRFIFGTPQETEKKLNHIGKPEHIINIGGGGFIHHRHLDKYNKGITIINKHIQRNLRINFYGGLLYELANYEYILGGTSLKEILINMGVELEENPEGYTFKNPKHINPDLFNYTVYFYKKEYEHY